MRSDLAPLPRSETSCAQLMASAWSACYGALLHGDPTVSRFAEWLAGFWEPSLECPDGTPDALSALAIGGRGIEWYERDGWVFGIVPGQSGGYLLPRATILEQLWPRVLAPAA
jgi:hypothetical protein